MKNLVNNRIKNALTRLYYYDKEILNNDSHERSITHWLAVHLKTVFYEWDVDVEYNRNLGDIKSLDRATMQLFEMIKPEELATGRKSVYPDIIVHKRNTTNNHVVIEVKKTKPNEVLEDFDKIKLKSYLVDSSLNYQFAAFIKLGRSTDRPRYSIELKTKDEVLSEITQGELNFR